LARIWAKAPETREDQWVVDFERSGVSLCVTAFTLLTRVSKSGVPRGRVTTERDALLVE
jgi:hypothetical protein